MKLRKGVQRCLLRWHQHRIPVQVLPAEDHLQVLSAEDHLSAADHLPAADQLPVNLSLLRQESVRSAGRGLAAAVRLQVPAEEFLP